MCPAPFSALEKPKFSCTNERTGANLAGIRANFSVEHSQVKLNARKRTQEKCVGGEAVGKCSGKNNYRMKLRTSASASLLIVVRTPDSEATFRN